MADYSKSCIYMIKTGNDTYIGSTCDFDMRVRCHNQRLYSNSYRYNNTKLYKTIREHNTKWEMIKLNDYPCDNDTELKIEERRVYDALQPTLNERKPYQTYDEEMIQKKESRYREMDRKLEVVTCECGANVVRCGIARHRKTKKHIELMG